MSCSNCPHLEHELEQSQKRCRNLEAQQGLPSGFSQQEWEMLLQIGKRWNGQKNNDEQALKVILYDYYWSRLICSVLRDYSLKLAIPLVVIGGMGTLLLNRTMLIVGFAFFGVLAYLLHELLGKTIRVNANMSLRNQPESIEAIAKLSMTDK